MKDSNVRHGFSLVELMVLVAVGISLFALVMPLYSAKKDRAMGTQCLGNLKELGVAMKLYGADWDGKFPWAYEWNSPGLNNINDCLLKYTSGPTVFRCPADRGDTAAESWGRNGKAYWEVFDTSYNYPGVNYIGMFPHLAGLPQSNPKISNPSPSQKWVWDLPLAKRVMLFDGRPWHRSTNKPKVSWTQDYPGVANALFCDGHAGPMDNRLLLTYLGIFPSTGEPK